MPVAKPGSICWTTALALAAALAVAAAAVPRLTQMVEAPSIGLEVAKGEGRIPGRLRHATGRGSAKSSSSELERKLCSIDEVAERDGDCAMEAEAGDDGPDELVMEAELDRADDTDEGSEEHEAERLVPADVVVRFRRRRRRELALAEKIEPLTPSRCVSISNSGPSSETESETRFLRHMGPIGCQLGSISIVGHCESVSSVYRRGSSGSVSDSDEERSSSSSETSKAVKASMGGVERRLLWAGRAFARTRGHSLVSLAGDFALEGREAK